MIWFRRRPAEPRRVLFVLGMHRSGTSCLTGCLEECGLTLGAVNESSVGNERGSRENPQIMLLNDRLLADNFGSWDEPPAEIVWTRRHRQRRDKLLSRYPSRELVGIKDPRCLLTFEFWREGIAEAELVGTFRHPLAVAKSLQCRNDFSIDRGLNLWTHYNQRLLDLHDEFGFPIVSFDLPPDDYTSCVQGVAVQLELTPPEGGFEFFEARLRHQATDDGQGSDLAPPVRDVLLRLQEAGAATCHCRNDS